MTISYYKSVFKTTNDETLNYNNMQTQRLTSPVWDSLYILPIFMIEWPQKLNFTEEIKNFNFYVIFNRIFGGKNYFWVTFLDQNIDVRPLHQIHTNSNFVKVKVLFLTFSPWSIWSFTKIALISTCQNP